VIGLGGDVVEALRGIVRAPLLAAVIVASMAVGIGVNTVVFSWIQARMLRPFPGVAQGASFHGVEPRTRTGQYPGASWLEYQDLRRRLQSFQDLIAWRMTLISIGDPGKVERGSGVLISPNYFAALDIPAAAGRFPSVSEVEGGGAPVAVISHGLSQKLFAGPEAAIGRTIRVNGRVLTVVGVAPAGFHGTVTGLFFEVYMPAALAREVGNGSMELTERSSRGYLMMGRLRDGVTPARAQTELDAAMGELARDHPETSGDVRGEVAAAWNLPRGPSRMLNGALAVLQGAMLLVLFAVCGNIANLALARGSARYKELGIRMALGASRGRVVRLMLTETTVLALLGAIAGVAIAVWGTNALRVLPLSGLPLRLDTTIDAYGLLVALALGVTAGLAIGAAPAWHIANLDPHAAYREGVKTSARSRLRDGLMVVQTCLAVIVLIATGISLASYLETRHVDTGFRQEGVMLAAYDLSGRSRTPAEIRALNRTLLDRVRAIPGVEAAALASSVPLDIHGLPLRNISVEGRARVEAGSDQTSSNTVSPGYFDVMGIPFVSGRDFAALDDPGAPLQVVVSEAFVRRFIESGEPIGRQVVARARPHVIVGVVRDSVANAFGEPPTPVLYFSYRDAALPIGELHVRVTPGVASTVAVALRAAVGEVDSEVPVFNVRSLTAHVETNLFLRRIPARMFAVIGPMLLALLALGIYAVVAYTSSLRRTEVGVRLAMGAVPGQIVAQLVREGLTAVVIGATIGCALALVATRRLLPGAIDPTVFVVVPLLLVAVAAAACWLPARAASRLDPTAALRPS
jgi:predicted permease